MMRIFADSFYELCFECQKLLRLLMNPTRVWNTVDDLRKGLG